jgi:hypothetical protein
MASVLVHCTGAIHPRPRIAIPPNLSVRDAETVVLFALADQPLPPELTTSERLADHALKAAFLWRYKTINQPINRWFVESFEPGVIYAGYKLSSLYLRVAIRFADQTVTTDVVESQHLHQGDNSIHQTALLWIDNLETNIRQVLGTVAAARKLYEENQQLRPQQLPAPGTLPRP